MGSMFDNCSSLTSLDLSSFDTGNVTDMSAMFANRGNLKTIYVGDNWSTQKVTSSDAMFDGCEMLCGGKGTKYIPGKVTAEYAHVDEGESNPGYLTQKGNTN